jgi:hypothetical protein
MTTAQLSALDPAEAVEVLRWRLGRLVAAGYGLEDALQVATNLEIDLHAATDLVARGCPPKTALRILS